MPLHPVFRLPKHQRRLDRLSREISPELLLTAGSGTLHGGRRSHHQFLVDTVHIDSTKHGARTSHQSRPSRLTRSARARVGAGAFVSHAFARRVMTERQLLGLSRQQSNGDQKPVHSGSHPAARYRGVALFWRACDRRGTARTSRDRVGFFVSSAMRDESEKGETGA